MRRRIYLDPESGPEDATSCWPLWGMRWREEGEFESLPVLRDEELWNAYAEARDRAHALARVIRERITSEPWDEVELSLGQEAARLLDSCGGYDAERVEEIERLLDENARSK
ncbi:MAG: hypothetical protein AB7E70_19705 [Hyphomicrobiaceae bacterium]